VTFNSFFSQGMVNFFFKFSKIPLLELAAFPLLLPGEENSSPKKKKKKKNPMGFFFDFLNFFFKTKKPKLGFFISFKQINPRQMGS